MHIFITSNKMFVCRVFLFVYLYIVCQIREFEGERSCAYLTIFFMTLMKQSQSINTRLDVVLICDVVGRTDVG